MATLSTGRRRCPTAAWATDERLKSRSVVEIDEKHWGPAKLDATRTLVPRADPEPTPRVAASWLRVQIASNYQVDVELYRFAEGLAEEGGWSEGRPRVNRRS